MTMTKLGVIAAGVLLVVGLTGCVQSSEDPAHVDEPTTSENTEVAETAEVEAAPLEAEETEVETAPEDPEGEFLEVMHRSADRLGLADASDEQFLAAGSDACEQLDAGKADFEVRVIENEKPKGEVLYEGSRVIATYAQKFLCPEVSPR